METIIRAATALSPQQTFGRTSFPGELKDATGDRLRCAEPDYRNYIDPSLIRRMSRIIKMGVATARESLREAGIGIPDAIVTGTAYGCLSDTVQFLTRIIEQKEAMLSPTAFIQSTHNTVGGQIALMLRCHGYNNTFVHRGLSFESALLDATLLLEETDGTVFNVLVGSVEEVTDTSHAILRRFGMYRRYPVAGEGAAFFVLTNGRRGEDDVKLDAVSTFYKPKGIEEIERRIVAFLAERQTGMEDIDLVITGRDGGKDGDAIYGQLLRSVFRAAVTIPYKHLCGEYPTSASFALWFAVQILRSGTIPTALGFEETETGRIRRILIYNHYLGIHHSLIMLSAC
ncbi:MAG: beta-ketoacyl synthase chain length factor [Bacteroidota bacterium]|nr:beta-ketoacyl synthase chain length factor [Bacteroidota bacterium]MDP4217664.1 beta-ketoacyl synthase chain length factor [Bacteroidota bacterium]MDP4245133.1 beta-ketoacyl synthase chain length factor [Bacteroidota bacterium]MDP4256794.1 beta-ketoacyl synthase chain length factor [Bacteroidota bacterium]